MGDYAFNVIFTTGGSRTVHAGCKAQAIILAQALQIKDGLEYRYIKDVFVID